MKEEKQTELKRFDLLLSDLNSLDSIQKSMDWMEDIPDDLWKKHFVDNTCRLLKCGLDVDKHRWFETSISVYEIYDRILGVQHISDLFSESSSCEDVYFTPQFFEMREVQTVSYEPV